MHAGIVVYTGAVLRPADEVYAGDVVYTRAVKSCCARRYGYAGAVRLRRRCGARVHCGVHRRCGADRHRHAGATRPPSCLSIPRRRRREA
eukprot:7763387-Pyramimonas_sp.AAC.1